MLTADSNTKLAQQCHRSWGSWSELCKPFNEPIKPSIQTVFKYALFTAWLCLTWGIKKRSPHITLLTEEREMAAPISKHNTRVTRGCGEAHSRCTWREGQQCPCRAVYQLHREQPSDKLRDLCDVMDVNLWKRITLEGFN